MSTRTLRLFAETFGEDPDKWIALGRLELAGAIQRDVSDPSPSRPSTMNVRVIGTVSADTIVAPEEENGERVFPVLPEHGKQADGGVVEVRGHSMIPMIQPGDFLGISKLRAPVRGDVVLAKRGEEVYLKRLSARKGRWLKLESDNPAFAPIEGDDLEIVGVVVWSHRQKFS